MSNPFTALWTDKDSEPNIGHWEIFYLGQWLILSEEKRGHGLAEEIFEDEWMTENGEWLNELFSKYGIPVDKMHMHWLYQAINTHDWRCGSFYDLL